MSTAQNVADIADRMRLRLSDSELSRVIAIVEKTGHYAPTGEVLSHFRAKTLTPPMLTFFVPWMWRYRPDTSPVGTELWRALFEHTYYTEDMVVRTRPKVTVRAYRGATADNYDGLSWSLDRGQAEYFARYRQAPGAEAHVWVTNIPPGRMYARYLKGPEQEVTADVRGLDIYGIEDERQLARPRKRRWRR